MKNKNFYKFLFPVFFAAVSLSSSFVVASAEEGDQLPLPGLGEIGEGGVQYEGFVSWAHLIKYSDVDTVFQGIEDMLPVLLPIIVGFLGIRKALSFLRGSLLRA